MGTLGVALDVCAVPGAPPSARLGPDDVELGLGIHGEPGFETARWLTLEDLVPRMLRRVLGYKSGPGGGAAGDALNGGGPLALLVNNLGGSSNLELAAVADEALGFLRAEGVGGSPGGRGGVQGWRGGEGAGWAEGEGAAAPASLPTLPPGPALLPLCPSSQFAPHPPRRSTASSASTWARA
jgi:hypothetical protein